LIIREGSPGVQQSIAVGRWRCERWLDVWGSESWHDWWGWRNESISWLQSRDDAYLNVIFNEETVGDW